MTKVETGVMTGIHPRRELEHGHLPVEPRGGHQHTDTAGNDSPRVGYQVRFFIFLFIFLQAPCKN